jgi:DNA-directed RNA polymerase subunit RPC12/RpoP
MRLIDADALRAEYQAILDRGDMFCEYDIIGMVDNAPTIETTIENLISTLSVEELKATTQFKVDTPSGEAVSFRREKTGHWIKEDEQNLCGLYRCSECGRRVEDLTDDIKIHAGCEDYTIADIYPYCHCGSKMTGGAE